MATKRRTRAATPASDDAYHMRACIEMQLCDAQGAPVADRVVFNTIMTDGRKWVMQKIVSTTNQTNSINFIAVGTSTAAVNSSQTGLSSEITATLGRKAIGTVDATNMTSSAPSWAASVLFATNEANNSIGEIGLFNTSTAQAATMLGRATFTQFNKSDTNTLAVTYTVSN